MSFSSYDSDGERRPRRRDRLLSLAESTSLAIKKEINKYYESSPLPPPLPPRTRSMKSTTSNEPMHTEIKRTDTEELDEIIKDSVPEIIQPQCMLFPTYACQVDGGDDEEEEKEVKWKIHLAGWAFANPGSSRLDRWILGKSK